MSVPRIRFLEPMLSYLLDVSSPVSRSSMNLPCLSARIPARITVASSVPAVMKSATIAPFWVMAVVYGPL